MRQNIVETIKSHWATATAVVFIVAWLFNTFATTGALAEKEKSLTSYVDEKNKGVETSLNDIKAVLDRVDQRVYELNKKDSILSGH